MRKYRNIEPERWRAILGLLRWQLSLRVAGLERARTWGAAPQILLARRLLQEAYDDSRFLHLFLGYSRETALEQRASQLLRTPQHPSSPLRIGERQRKEKQQVSGTPNEVSAKPNPRGNVLQMPENGTSR